MRLPQDITSSKLRAAVKESLLRLFLVLHNVMTNCPLAGSTVIDYSHLKLGKPQTTFSKLLYFFCDPLKILLELVPN